MYFKKTINSMLMISAMHPNTKNFEHISTETNMKFKFSYYH